VACGGGNFLGGGVAEIAELESPGSSICGSEFRIQLGQPERVIASGNQNVVLSAAPKAKQAVIGLILYRMKEHASHMCIVC
jgi:hypothetical protein